MPVGSSVFDEGGGGLLSIPAPASVAVGYDPPAEGAKASASGSVASSLPPVGKCARRVFFPIVSRIKCSDPCWSFFSPPSL